MPRSLEELFANNDVEFFDLEADPHEMDNLAVDPKANGELLMAINEKLNALIESEVGDDIGQMLPGGSDASWALDASIYACSFDQRRGCASHRMTKGLAMGWAEVLIQVVLVRV